MGCGFEGFGVEGLVVQCGFGVCCVFWCGCYVVEGYVGIGDCGFVGFDVKGCRRCGDVGMMVF